MEIQPAVKAKVEKYRKLLFFVNFPLLIGIPLYVELGPLHEKPNFALISMMLHLCDGFLFFNSFLIYSVMKQIVSYIAYMPEEHKIKVKQFCNWRLTEVEREYACEDLIKAKKSAFNPFIGYKGVKDPNVKLGTESVGLWQDRELFDSLIFRED